MKKQPTSEPPTDWLCFGRGFVIIILFLLYFEGIPFNMQIILRFLTGWGDYRQYRVTGSPEIGMQKVVFDDFLISDGNVTVLGIRKKHRVRFVKRVLLVVTKYVGTVNRGI